MKYLKSPFLLLLVLGLAAISFIGPPHDLKGRWQVTENTPNGVVTFLAIFRADDTYDAFLNGKALVAGGYHLKNDTVTMWDHLCDPNSRGLYKVTFVNPDSILFSVITDTCKARREGTDKVTLGRIKSKK